MSERMPKVGEVWTSFGVPRTILAVHGEFIWASHPSGDCSTYRAAWVAENWTPPRPPLPEVPETVWVNVWESGAGLAAHKSRQSADDDATMRHRLAVAEYRLHEVHEVTP